MMGKGQMGEATEGSQIFGQHTGLSEKLCCIAKDLQSPSLLLQMKILDKIIYKYKNQHSRAKFFQDLEKMKKSLNRLKMLSLDQKVIAINKTICDAGVNSVPHNLKDFLTEVMHGGKLVIRTIVLCQETVQYTTGYLSLGFFVAFHVTLFALISRIWVLLKHCWFTLVECYQLVRLVGHSSSHQNSSNITFPECLTLWLHEDLKDVYRVVANVDAKTSCPGSETLKTKLLGKVNASEKGILTNSMMTGGSLDDDNIDLGEPVKDTSVRYIPTPASSKRCMQVSYLRKSLLLKFDVEHVDGKDSANDAKICRAVGLSGRKIQHDVVSRRESSKRVPYRKRYFRRVVTNRIFCTKKQSYRFTLRTLGTTNDYRCVPSRDIRGLLAVMNYLSRSEPVSPARKVLLKAKRLLERELKKRKVKKNGGQEEAIISLSLARNNGKDR